MSADDLTSRTELAPEDEASLLGRLRAGNTNAYDELVRTYAGRLRAVAHRIL